MTISKLIGIPNIALVEVSLHILNCLLKFNLSYNIVYFMFFNPMNNRHKIVNTGKERDLE